MMNASVMRKLGWFVMLSVVAHLWLLYGVPFEMPRFAAPPPVLVAHLQPAEPLPPVLPRAHPSPAHKPAAESVVSSPLPTEGPVYTPAPQAAPEPAAATEAPVPPPPIIAESKPVAAPPPLARRLPRKGEISYVLLQQGGKGGGRHATNLWD